MVQNLVLEIGENECAADVQARLNVAAEDGFFLVNVVGRLAFLRTSVSHKMSPQPDGRIDEDVKAVAFLKDHWESPDRWIAKACKTELGIDRSYKFFQRRRKDRGTLDA